LPMAVCAVLTFGFGFFAVGQGVPGFVACDFFHFGGGVAAFLAAGDVDHVLGKHDVRGRCVVLVVGVLASSSVTSGAADVGGAVADDERFLFEIYVADEAEGVVGGIVEFLFGRRWFLRVCVAVAGDAGVCAVAGEFQCGGVDGSDGGGRRFYRQIVVAVGASPVGEGVEHEFA